MTPTYVIHLSRYPEGSDMKPLLTALLLPLLPLAVQAADPVWITVGADSGVELKQVKAKLAPCSVPAAPPSSWLRSRRASSAPSPT